MADTKYISKIKVGNEYYQIKDLNTPSLIGNGKLTLKAGNNTQEFTANSFDNVTFEITAKDLGLDAALKFIGVSETEIIDGSDINPITLTDKSEHLAALGDVVLYNGKEFVRTNTAWEELGDESSHALKTTKIIAGGGLTGGGTLDKDVTIGHATYSEVSAAPYAIGCDSYGHVKFGKPLTTSAAGKYSSDTIAISASVAAGSFLTGVNSTNTQLAVATGDTSVISSVTPSDKKLVTTSITGVSGSTTASKVTVGAAQPVEVTPAVEAKSTADTTNGDLCLAKPELLKADSNEYALVLNPVAFAKAEISVPTYNITDVTVPQAATAITVATGATATDGKGAAIVESIQTSAATVLTSAALNGSNGTTVLTSVSGTSNAANVAINGSATINIPEHNHAVIQTA